MRPFDPIETPLNGPCLIEAGAGTGKTFTITTLVLRLVLQAGLAPEQILVVTFTTAATAELRDRVRGRLRDAKRALQGQHTASGELARLLSTCGPPDLAIKRLEDALANFDRMPVFTIHGFCQRVLSEMAFETGGSFEAELITDTTPIVQAIADDFWRRTWDRTPPEVMAFGLEKLHAPEDLAALYQRYAVPDLVLLPDNEGLPTVSCDRYRELAAEVRQAWHRSRDTVLGLLASPDLKANIYGRADRPADPGGGRSKRDAKCRSWARRIDRWAGAGVSAFPPPEDLAYFTQTKLDASLKKGGRRLEHAFFASCDRLWQAFLGLSEEMERWLIALKVDFFRYAAQELQRHKHERQVLFFDDLLLMLRDALRQDGRDALQQRLRSRYRAALIDEFQDTDAVQYAIFETLFGTGDPPLFLIGDPKQAIYSFRGADIFTYLAASRRAAQRYTLTTNWRSTPGMIQAVNLLFGRCANPFLWSAIAFHPATAAAAALPAPSDNTPCEAALTFWYLDDPADRPGGAGWTKQTATEAVGRALALQIRRIAGAGGKTHGAAYGDMAVLVRTNRQARAVKRHLSEARVPAVVYRAGSVFHGPEALDLQRLLEAVADPGDDGKLRTALCTALLGRRGTDLDFGTRTPEWWEAAVERFYDYRTLWFESGFIRMFRRLLIREKIAPRLLAEPAGERHLTNLLHLMELLHQASLDGGLGPDDLLHWLALQRQASNDTAEAHQLRLESDADAVTIMTVHKSKGLEFPVVFCPFVWEGLGRPRPPALCHDDRHGQRRVLDFGAPNLADHLARMAEEQMAEELRLLYVAVTRAKRRCYLVWGRLPSAEVSALAYLLASGCSRRSEAVSWEALQAMARDFHKAPPAAHRGQLMELARQSRGAIAVSGLPVEDRVPDTVEAAPRAPSAPRTYTRGPFQAWKIASFSALVHRRREEGEIEDDAPEQDEALHALRPETDRAEPSPSIGAIADFEAGARAGLLFHDILEHIDFGPEGAAGWPAVVHERLEAHGYPLHWTEPLLAMLARVMAAPLTPEGAAPFSFSQIHRQDRLVELAFHLPLRSLDAAALGRVFADCRHPDLQGRLPQLMEQLAFRVDGGYLKGYIDLVFRHDGRFYLADWKSNLLGAVYAAYRPAILAEVMADAYYFLQYHLYAAALDRFLRTSCADYRYADHFGGIFYCFIRGMGPPGGPPTGIFYDRPAESLIAQLGELLSNNNE